MKYNEIENIKLDIDFRKKEKKKIDRLINLSATENNVVTILNEGINLYSDGAYRFYIKKGTIQEYYDNLESDFVGMIRCSHNNLDNILLTTIGTFTKDDLSVEIDEDGRAKLLIKRKVFDDIKSPLLDIMQQNSRLLDLPVSISAEFYHRIDDVATKTVSDLLGAFVPVYDKVYINAFAFVSNPGNVDSYNVLDSSKEGDKMIFKDKVNKLNNDIKDALSSDNDIDDVSPDTNDISDTNNVSLDTNDTNDTNDIDGVNDVGNVSSDDNNGNDVSSDNAENKDAVIEELRNKIADMEKLIENLSVKNKDVIAKLKAQEELFSNMNISSAFSKDKDDDKRVDLSSSELINKVYY